MEGETLLTDILIGALNTSRVIRARRSSANKTYMKQVTEESINAVTATAGAAIYGLVANGWTADIVLARPQSLASPIRSRAIRKRPKKLLHQWCSRTFVVSPATRTRECRHFC